MYREKRETVPATNHVIKETEHKFAAVGASYILCKCENCTYEYKIATSGVCGNSATWDFDMLTSTLTVFGTGDMYKNCTSFNELKDRIKNVVISDGITSVSDEAFNGCKNLTDVTLSESVSKIGKNAFKDCEALKKIALSDKMLNIETGVFENCTALTEVTLSDAITSIGENAFRGCTGLKSVNIPKYVYTVGENAFTGCNALTLGVYKGTYGETYAESQGIPYEYTGNSALLSIPGDCNGDGEVDSSDLVRLKKYLAGQSVVLGK